MKFVESNVTGNHFWKLWRDFSLILKVLKYLVEQKADWYLDELVSEMRRLTGKIISIARYVFVSINAITIPNFWSVTQDLPIGT